MNNMDKSETKANVVHVMAGDRIEFEPEWRTTELDQTLDALKEAMLDLDMRSSLFQTVSGIAADVYRMMMDDYGASYKKCDAIKKKVSKAVMERFTPYPGATLSWNYDSTTGSLTVFAQK